MNLSSNKELSIEERIKLEKASPLFNKGKYGKGSLEALRKLRPTVIK